MNWRLWSRLTWVVVALVAAFLIVERVLYEWGEYRLRQVKTEVSKYNRDLYSHDRIEAGEVNGLDVLDATSALARLALSETDGHHETALGTSSFRRAFDLAQQHSHVYKAYIGRSYLADPGADLAQIRNRPSPATALFSVGAEDALRAGNLDLYLQLTDVNLAVQEWAARATPLPMSRVPALEQAGRVVAELGNEAPEQVHRVPETTRNRLRRLAQVDAAAALKAEVAYVLNRWELEREWGRRRPGGVVGLLYRVAAIQGSPAVTASHLETAHAWLKQLQSPPHVRDRESVVELGGPLTKYFMTMTDSMEVSKLQIQVAVAADLYLEECLRKRSCPSAPQVKEANGEIMKLDPYSGEPWRFVPRGRQCVFYSVGLDGIDNSGKLFAGGRVIRPGVDIGWLLPCSGVVAESWLDGSQ